jgi:myo-inositol-1(or 4)-monophosphatase
MGSPLWGCLVGCRQNGRMVFGAMDQPFTQERFWSDGEASYFSKGEGKAAREGRRLEARANGRLDEAIVTTTHPDLFEREEELPRFRKLAERARLVRYGGDCYGYALLALGGVDLVVEAGLQAYDIAPLIPILEGAGAVVTTWDGGPADAGGRILAAADARIHREAMELLG